MGVSRFEKFLCWLLSVERATDFDVQLFQLEYLQALRGFHQILQSAVAKRIILQMKLHLDPGNVVLDLIKMGEK